MTSVKTCKFVTGRAFRGKRERKRGKGERVRARGIVSAEGKSKEEEERVRRGGRVRGKRRVGKKESKDN